MERILPYIQGLREIASVVFKSRLSESSLRIISFDSGKEFGCLSVHVQDMTAGKPTGLIVRFALL